MEERPLPMLDIMLVSMILSTTSTSTIRNKNSRNSLSDYQRKKLRQPTISLIRQDNRTANIILCQLMRSNMSGGFSLCHVRKGLIIPGDWRPA